MDDLSNNEMLNIGFKGIELHGLNDKSFAHDMSHLERLDITTQRGMNMIVYARKGKNAKNMSILTFHDIGSNFKSFYGFFNYPEMKVISENFTIYHCCAPGHVPDDIIGAEESKRLINNSGSENDISRKVFSISNNQRRYSTTQSGPAYPTLDDLADMVTDVIDSLGLKLVLLMGIGAGSNVLSRVALKPDISSRLLGMILINPNDGQASMWPWAKLRWSDIPKLYGPNGYVTDGLQDWLLMHWFGTGSLELMESQNGPSASMDLVEYYLQTVRQMHGEGVAGYIDAYLCRSNLGLVRGTKVFPCDTLLMTGDYAKDLSRVMCDMNGNLDPAKTQFISVPDSSGMIMEENPERIAPIFLNFLRNLGIMVSMTPEKLKKLAYDLQIESAQRIYGHHGDNEDEEQHKTIEPIVPQYHHRNAPNTATYC